MEHKKVFIILSLFFNLIFLCMFFIIFKFEYSLFLSFEVAFFSFLLVIASSYLHYKKNIIASANLNQITSKPLMIFLKKYTVLPKIIHFKNLNVDLELNFKEKFKNFTLFFGILKLFSYGILVVGFLTLNHNNLLSIMGYLCGISTLLLSNFSFIIYVKKYES